MQKLDRHLAYQFIVHPTGLPVAAIAHVLNLLRTHVRFFDRRSFKWWGWRIDFLLACKNHAFSNNFATTSLDPAFSIDQIFSACHCRNICFDTLADSNIVVIIYLAIGIDGAAFEDL